MMRDVVSITAEELELLKSFDTPTVCNVIELFEVRPRSAGYMDGRIQCNFPKLPPMVGYATTATYRSAAPSPNPDVYKVMDEQIRSFADFPAPLVVVFQDLDDPPRAATFGDVMCTTYKAFGVNGLITSGAGRDLDQVEALAFPVFTSSTICAHGYCHTVDLNVPVSVGGITIYPGDLIHADRNGVTTIPNEIAGDVARNCQALADAETSILNYVRDAVDPTLEELVAARDRMWQQLKDLRQQLSRSR